jgi:hypothetical protein
METQDHNIYLLSSAEVHFYWGNIVEGLGTSHMLDFYSEETIFSRLLNGAMQCWALSNGEIELIIVSEVILYDKAKTLRFIGAFGRGIDRYLEVAETLFPRVARAMECIQYEVIGREGWGPKLKALGFKKRFTVFTRPLVLETEH